MAGSLHRKAVLHAQSLSESPLKNPLAKTSPADSSLSKTRANLLWDLNETVPVIQKKFFFDHLLPPSPLTRRRSLKGVVKKLKDDGIIQDDGCWAGWTKPSSNADQNETHIFKGLQDLTATIRDASDVKKDMTVEFICNGAISLKSHTRNNTSKPDCYAVRYPDAKLRLTRDKARKPQPLWLDVAVPGEFKKYLDPDTFNDNATKVLWSMHHIMREDARRRFVVGFSIDDCSMRLWYCSRSDVYASEAFDFFVDHDLFVDFVLRISYARPQQLGWDPTIILREPLRDGQPLEYDIAVTEKVGRSVATRQYRTVRILSNIGADTLRGRGTRVWEVIELDAKGKPTSNDTCILKDSWVDHDRHREGKIIADILEAAKSRSAEDFENVKKALLTVLMYGDVLVDGAVDKSRSWKSPKATDYLEVKVDAREFAKVESNLKPVGATAVNQASEATADDSFSTKVHHRIVFKEVGRTIREVTSLCEAFFCLIEIVYFLCILHELGWVHRDISSGNILVVNGRGKLSDFGYAKRATDESAHGVRTGTMYFMSHEVDEHVYLHDKKPDSESEKKGDQDDYRARGSDQIDSLLAYANNVKTASSDAEEDEDDILPVIQPTEAQATLLPFKHNPLHDLESVFWLAMYMLLAGTLIDVGSRKPKVSEAHNEAQQKLAEDLFCDRGFRSTVMLSFGLSKKLPKFALHPRIRQIVDVVDGVRASIMKAFEAAEKDLTKPIPFTVAHDENLYSTMNERLVLIFKSLCKSDVTMAIDEKASNRLRKALRERGDAAAQNASQADAAPPAEDDTGIADDEREAKRQKTSFGGRYTPTSGDGRPLRRSSHLSQGPSRSAPTN